MTPTPSPESIWTAVDAAMDPNGFVGFLIGWVLAGWFYAIFFSSWTLGDFIACGLMGPLSWLSMILSAISEALSIFRKIL